MIRMICEMRLFDRVLANVPSDSVHVVLKIENITNPSHMRWYSQIMREVISSHIREVMELKITGKRKEGPPRNHGKGA